MTDLQTDFVDNARERIVLERIALEGIWRRGLYEVIMIFTGFWSIY